MTMVIATGCPHSDWEKVLPILELAGLELAGDTFSQWYDELFRPVGMVDPPQPDYPLQIVPRNGGSVAKLLPGATTEPLLLAKSRSLWLLDFWAAKLPHAQFLLFYTSAEAAVANACVKGMDPLQFLEGWQVANRQLLRFQRCHRGQALLLDAEVASRQPQELIQICRQIGLTLQFPSEIPPSNFSEAPVERLLANYLVADIPDVRALQSELEAAAQPLADNMPAEQLQSVELVSSYLQRQAHERRLRQALNETEEKLNIAEQVQKEQKAKIYELTNDLGDQANLVTEARAQLEQLQKQLEESDAAIASLQEEVNSRQDEISRHQWYLGERDADIVRLKENLAAQDDELSRMQHELYKQHENTQRQNQEYLAEIDFLKDSLTKKNDVVVSLDHLLSERDVTLREIEHSLVVRDEEMALLASERQSQMDEKFKFAKDLQSQLEQITNEKNELDRKAAEQQQTMASLFRKQDESARQTSDLQAQIQHLTQERDAQKKLSGEQRAKIEQFTRGMDEKEKHLAEQQAQMEQLRQDYQKSESSNKEAAQENELLLLQLHQVQEELAAEKEKKLQAQIEQLTRARDEQTKLATDRQAQIEKLTQIRDEQVKVVVDHQSLIKKLTQDRDEKAKLAAEKGSQIEKVQQALDKLESEKKEAVQENELLLLQLHQVQEELEDIFLRNQNLKQAHDRSEAANKQLAEEKEKLSMELQRVERDLLEKDEEIEMQRQRAKRLKQTVSWKITTPLRAMARLFRKSNKENNELNETNEEVTLLKTSGLFDEAWYLAENEDVAKEGTDPVEHFIRHGAAEGRNPSPAFDLRKYLEINPDVAAAGINPLIHFAKFGRAEGRRVAC